MRLNRWAMMHGRDDQPGYRYICTVHWTKYGALRMAAEMMRMADMLGYDHLYWVERLMGDDKPGDFYLLAPGVPSS